MASSGPTGGNRLQPYHVFVAEHARLNEVYWTSRYALERSPHILGAIAKTASAKDDPRIDELWGSSEPRMQQQLTIRLSEFHRRTVDVMRSIRAFSIVGICSAFENALSNYFVLACLYKPKAALNPWNHAAAPKVLKNQSHYSRLRKRALERAAEVLRAGYGGRVRNLLEIFEIERRDLTLPAELESYYDQRHLLAHNQGVQEDGPWLPPQDLLTARVVLDEEKWRQMLADFENVIAQLDRYIQTVVPNRAVHLAAHSLMENPQVDSITIGSLRHRINVGWHLNERNRDIEIVVRDLGYSISNEKRLSNRKVTRS
jgi:hypothetical protein